MQKLVIFSVASRLGKVENVEVCVRKMQDRSESSNEELEDGEIQVTNIINSNACLNMCASVLNGEMPSKRRFPNGEAEDTRKIKRTPDVYDDQHNLEHRHDAPRCEHIEEIENLKRQLKARDVEVQALQKLVASLQRLQ
ncbi:hypothetical protein O6H91_14G023300 [Diphasiastrum complanatum]|nr:hypothetical protein O6H91_14G023300 [Diphasiastrum complanatum]